MVRRGAMKLEEQIEKLAAIGIRLAPGITVDDLLRAYKREMFEEQQPFDVLAYAFGVDTEEDPGERNFSNIAYTLDLEFADELGAYLVVVENLARLTGNPSVITGIEDTADPINEEGGLEYMVGGELQKLAIEFDDCWGDPDVLSTIMEDIESQVPGRTFYAVTRGQVSTWYLITPDQADSMRALGISLTGHQDAF